MSIKVKCPNGHQLKVKDSFAGKVGLCPICKAPIRVPVPEPAGMISEDDIIDVLGPHRPQAPSSASASGISLDMVSDSSIGIGVSKANPILGTSDSSLQLGEWKAQADASGSSSGSSPGHAMPKKICSKCNREISVGFHICPFCRTYLTDLGSL